MRRSLLVAPVLVAIAAFGLVACTGGGGTEPVTSATPTSASSAASVEPSASASASSNAAVASASPKFAQANQAVASTGSVDDHSVVDGLAAAGFDKQAMQITPDTTTIGRKVDSIEVSVLVGSTCLLGQFTGTTYVGETSPVLSSGKCLLGNTRSIDW